MALPRQRRRLKDCFNEAFPYGPVKVGLEKWVSSERYGRTFNGEKDAFDPTAARFTVMDMTNVSEDTRLSAALTYYYMERIDAATSRKETPHALFVDEAGTLLLDEAFAAKIAAKLRTARKNHGAMGLVFQEVGAFANNSISQVLLANVKTKFIWPGTAQTEEECKVIGLNDWQTRFALGQADRPRGASKYCVLMVREGESALLDFDLSPIGPLLKFFHGGAGPTERMVQCIKDHGLLNWRHEFINLL